MKEKLIKKLEEKNGDIFELYIYIYDLISEKHQKKGDIEFYSRVFESIRTSEEFLFPSNMIKMEPEMLKQIYEKINTQNIKINKEDDIEIISKILSIITRRAIAIRLKSNFENSRNDYLKQIEYLKYGILK